MPCSLRFLLSLSAGKTKSPASRPAFCLPNSSGFISMVVEIILDSAPIILYSLKYGKVKCRCRIGRARAGQSPRHIPAAGGGRAARNARRRDRQHSQARAQYAHLSFRPPAHGRPGDRAQGRPLDDLCGALRNDERAARLSHRKLLQRLGRCVRPRGRVPARAQETQQGSCLKELRHETHACARRGRILKLGDPDSCCPHHHRDSHRKNVRQSNGIWKSRSDTEHARMSQCLRRLVEDLQNAIGFYSALFATQPSVVKPDYAKWMLDDPRVNFAISTRGKQPGLDHLGIQVESQDELQEGNLEQYSLS